MPRPGFMPLPGAAPRPSRARVPKIPSPEPVDIFAPIDLTAEEQLDFKDPPTFPAGTVVHGAVRTWILQRVYSANRDDPTAALAKIRQTVINMNAALPTNPIFSHLYSSMNAATTNLANATSTNSDNAAASTSRNVATTTSDDAMATTSGSATNTFDNATATSPNAITTTSGNTTTATLANAITGTAASATTTFSGNAPTVTATMLAQPNILQRVLSNPLAWNVLDESEKVEILSLIPPLFHPDTSLSPIPPPDAEFLLYSTDWSGAIRQFSEDVQAGRYATTFRTEAEQANRDRAAGKLTNIPQTTILQRRSNAFTPLNSGRIHLQEMVRAGVFCAGDIIVLNHNGNQKEFLVTGTAGGSLVIGHAGAGVVAVQGLSEANLELFEADSPSAFLAHIYKEEFGGKAPGKAWQLLRLRRGGQDLGALKEVRCVYNNGKE